MAFTFNFIKETLQHTYILVSLILIILSSQTVSAQDFEYNGLKYTVISEELKTCKTADNVWGNPLSYSGDISIPPVAVRSYGNSYTVVEIGYMSFSQCSGINSVTLPSTITLIDKRAFDSCINLTSITIPESVSEIRDGAFIHCKSLKSINFPQSLSNIPSSVCYDCKALEECRIPENVQSIGDEAFRDCSSLKSLYIPKSVSEIGERVIMNCSALASLVVNSSNTIFDSRDGCNAVIETNTNNLIMGCSTTVIPSSIEIIGKDAFYGMEVLSGIVFPESVKEIKNLAFFGCKGLRQIIIPESVIIIEGNVFEDCSSLNEIKVDPANTIYDSHDNCNAIIEKLSGTLISACNNSFIPSGVTTIGDRAFDGCSQLDEIIIPETVKKINDYAFSGCSGLKSILLPNSVKELGIGSFYCCYSLEEITFSEALTIIPKNAFDLCKSLKVATLPQSITKIEESAFEYCTNLTEIVLPKNIDSIGLSAFFRCPNIEHIICLSNQPPAIECKYIFDQSVISKAILETPDPTLYSQSASWGSFKNIREMSLYSCQSLQLPECIIVDEGESFNIESKITPYYAANQTLTWSASDSEIVRMGASLLALKPGITKITAKTVDGSNLEASCIVIVKKKGMPFHPTYSFESDGIFYKIIDQYSDEPKVMISSYGYAGSSQGGDGNLIIYGQPVSGAIQIPATVKDPNGKTYKVKLIDQTAFSTNTRLASIVIDPGVMLDGAVFYGCTGLIEVILPSDITSLPAQLFDGCSMLTHIKIPQNVTRIESSCFTACGFAKLPDFPQSVVSAGSNLFSRCPNLREVVVPNHIKVYNGWFDYCDNLETIVFGEDLEEIAYSSLWGCSKIKTIVFSGKKINKIYKDAFNIGYSEINPNLKFYMAEGVDYSEFLPNYSKEQFKSLGHFLETATKEYDGQTPALSFSSNLPDFNCELASPKSIDKNAGIHNSQIPVTFSNNNLSFQSTFSASYTITKAPLAISVGEYNRPYGTDNPEVRVEYSGFKDDETADVLSKQPQIHIEADKNSPVGKYTISVTGAEAQNYSISYEYGILTVTKAEQTIEWVQDFTEVKVGDEVDLTAVASSGLVIEYTSSNSEVAEIDGSHVKFLGEGSVTITAFQVGDDNYNEAQSLEKEINVSLLSSIDTINEDAVWVNVEHNKIVIHTHIDNLDITIYNMNGNIDYRGNDRIISLPRGIYIVSISGKTYKIIL